MLDDVRRQKRELQTLPSHAYVPVSFALDLTNLSEMILEFNQALLESGEEIEQMPITEINRKVMH